MPTRLNLLTPVHERTSTRSALPLTLTSSLIHTHPPTHPPSLSLACTIFGNTGCSGVLPASSSQVWRPPAHPSTATPTRSPKRLRRSWPARTIKLCSARRPKTHRWLFCGIQLHYNMPHMCNAFWTLPFDVSTVYGKRKTLAPSGKRARPCPPCRARHVSSCTSSDRSSRWHGVCWRVIGAPSASGIGY